MNSPQYPIYIISKGRWESRLTSKALELISVPYHIVVEPQEYDNYASVIDKNKILVLPFSNLGQGGIPARNWVWEHSISIGAKRHWILDDNIGWFARVNFNKKIKVNNGLCFKITEDFVDRYKNIALAGLQYGVFAPSGQKIKPYVLNTRVYSCILIKNDIPFRWRGRYNEDTDLSIRVLKAGWCTFLIQIFVCDKMTTMTMKGGNTESLYKLNNADGRLLMAQSLQKQHPDIVKIKRKFGRWQHSVNFKIFKKNILIPCDDIDFSKIPKVNNYGMKIIKTKGNCKREKNI
jgi:hypothetical protein